MKAKRQIESSLNSVTMLDGTGGHVNTIRRPLKNRERTGADSLQRLELSLL